MVKYKVVKENSEYFSIYHRKFLFWSYVVMKPSFDAAKRYLYEQGCRTFIFVE